MVRHTFLETVDVAAELLDTPGLGDHWDEPAVLEGYTVGGLAGHLARAAITVDRYLDDDPATGTPIGPAEYFIRGLGDVDPINDTLHRAVRERGEQAGAIGPTALADEVRAIRGRLTERFEAEPADRLVSVFQGLAMRLDEYLETRIVELVIHLDDLATSAGLPSPRVAREAEALVLRTLVEMATARHGASVMIRALARRERISEWPAAF